jgi:capsid assembly protease
MNPALLAARYAGRPLLMTPVGAEQLARRVLAFDDAALRRPRGWLDDPLRALSRVARGRPLAEERDDDDREAVIAPARPRGYAPLWMAGEPQAEGYGWTLFEGVACMSIEGPLMAQGFEMCGAMFWGYDLIAASLREACADASVAGVFIRMESPGGVVAGGLEALTAQMRGLREAAGGKPVWVYADMAASAAYWIASAADRIVAPPVGMVGSIGAVIVHEEVSRANELHGVTVTPIQFGAKKTDGAPWAPLSASAKADLQAEIDEVGLRFVRDVARGRPQLTVDALIATEAAMHLAVHPDPARSGVALGLVDAIASEEAAFRQLVAHAAALAAKPKVSTQPSTSGGAPPRTSPKRAPGATQQKEEKMAQRTTRRFRAGPEEDAALRQEIGEIVDNADLSDADALTLIRGKVGAAPAEEVEPEEAEVVAEGEEPMPEEGEQPAPEDEEKVAPAAKRNAEGEDGAPADEEEPKAPAARAQKILRLPEAKGRETLAGELAAQAYAGAMTVAAARRVLALTPKAGGSKLLGANVPDPKLGGGGATKTLTADEQAAASINRSFELATGRKVRG